MISLHARLVASELAEHTEGLGHFKRTYLHDNGRAAERAEVAVAAWLRELAAHRRGLADTGGGSVATRIPTELRLEAAAFDRLADELQHVHAHEVGTTP